MSNGLSLTERLEQMVSKKVREIKLRFIIMWLKSCDIKSSELDTWSNYINVNDWNIVKTMNIVGSKEIQSDPWSVNWSVMISPYDMNHIVWITNHDGRNLSYFSCITYGPYVLVNNILKPGTDYWLYWCWWRMSTRH